VLTKFKKTFYGILALCLLHSSMLCGQAFQGKTAHVRGQSESIALEASNLVGAAVFYTTFDGSTTATPLAQDVGGSPFFSRELRPTAFLSADYLTDYLVISPNSSVLEFGSLAIRINAGDGNFDGVPDEFELERFTNMSTSGNGQAHSPTARDFALPGVFNRTAGDRTGSYSLRFPGNVDVAGQFRIVDWTGSVGFVRGPTNSMTFNLTYNRPDGVASFFTGQSEFFVVNDSLIEFPQISLTNEVGQIITTQPSQFSRIQNRFRGRLNVSDGFTVTSWADYTDHILEFEDNNDFDLDTIPDLSDEVLSLPSIVSSPQTGQVGAGGTITLGVEVTSDTSVSFQWRFNGIPLPGATFSTLTLPNFQANNVGAYDVIVGNAGGILFSQSAFLSLAFPPTILVQAQSISVTVNQPVSFQVSAEGTPPLTYQWSVGATPIEGANHPIFSIPSATTSNQGNYRVSVSNAAGTVTSTSALLTVFVPPEIVQNLEPQMVVEPGFPLELQVVVSGSEPLSYQWRLNGQALPGQFEPIFRINSILPHQGGLYDVVISNQAGQTPSNSILVIVGSPPNIASGPTDIQARHGERVMLSVEVEGTPPLTYSWTHNNLPITGVTGSSVSIESLTLPATGSYQVTITNSAGTVTSRAINVQLNQELLSISRSADGNSINIRIQGLPSTGYTIQTSNDLATWEPVLVIENIDTPRTLEFPITEGSEPKFYRAIQLN
jgi:hypothetical protein